MDSVEENPICSSKCEGFFSPFKLEIPFIYIVMCVRFLYHRNGECLNIVMCPQQNIKEKRIR